MSGPPAAGKWNDRRVEAVIGNLLRSGVIAAASVVLAGGAIFLYRHGAATSDFHTFHPPPKAWGTLSGLFSIETANRGRSIIMTGIVILLLTPVARVAFSLAAFVLERDWLYAVITAIVLSLLLFSLVIR